VSPREGALPGREGGGAGADVVRVEAMSSLDGERLDRAVALLAGLSRSEATRLVALGGVRVGRATVTSGSRRVRSGDRLEIELHRVASSGNVAADISSGHGDPRGLFATGEGPGTEACEDEEASGPMRGRPPEPKIVFVDHYLVVVDKPAGLVVHPGAGNLEGTLVQKLVAAFPDIATAGPDELRPGVVHRLDKGTSGLLVVARTGRAREQLAKQMASHTVTRRYLAMVHGEVADDEGIIEAPLGRSPSRPLKVAVVQGGRPSRTRYQVLGRATSPFPATLLACRLETGRTHQVRAHLAAIGHPLLGDDRYASAGQVALVRRQVGGLWRPWLHAAELGFVHPITGVVMTFASTLPAELEEALECFGLGGSQATSSGRDPAGTTMAT